MHTLEKLFIVSQLSDEETNLWKSFLGKKFNNVYVAKNDFYTLKDFFIRFKGAPLLLNHIKKAKNSNILIVIGDGELDSNTLYTYKVQILNSETTDYSTIWIDLIPVIAKNVPLG